MVVFRCIDKLPDLDDFFPSDFSEFSEDEIEEAFAWSHAILPSILISWLLLGII